MNTFIFLSSLVLYFLKSSSEFLENFSSPKEWNWSWFHLSQDPGSWSYTNPRFVHMPVFKNTLVHVFFLCDSIGVFIIQREKRVCKESGTLVFISFPSRASSRPRLSRGLPAKRGGGLSGKGGSILCGRGCWGYSWWLLFVHIISTRSRIYCKRRCVLQFWLFELGWSMMALTDEW